MSRIPLLSRFYVENYTFAQATFIHRLDGNTLYTSMSDGYTFSYWISRATREKLDIGK